MIWRKKIYIYIYIYIYTNNIIYIIIYIKNVYCLKRWKNTERIMHLSKYAVFGDVY